MDSPNELEAHQSGALLDCRGRCLDLSTPQVMGIINVTPDSFSDGSRSRLLDVAWVDDVAGGMLEAGAAILDVGGESTRPGAAPVTASAEADRVMPVLERLCALDTIVSIDTSKPSVAELALDMGAHLVNDVRAARTKGMLDVIADSQAAICLMHMQGTPQTMQLAPSYRDVVGEVRAFLSERIQSSRAAGIRDERLLLDPGFGFGKSLQHNLVLLRRLRELRVAGRPLAVGLSRKGLLGALTGRPVEERLAAGLAAATLAVHNGASVIRTHDVPETVDALRIAHEVLNE